MEFQKQFKNWHLAVWFWSEYPSCKGWTKPCFHFEEGVEFVWPITRKHSFHFFLGRIEDLIKQDIQDVLSEGKNAGE